MHDTCTTHYRDKDPEWDAVETFLKWTVLHPVEVVVVVCCGYNLFSISTDSCLSIIVLPSWSISCNFYILANKFSESVELIASIQQ